MAIQYIHTEIREETLISDGANLPLNSFLNEEKGSMPEIHAGRQLIPWVIAIVFAALIVSISAAWIYLQWSIYIQTYQLKAGLDWFQIVFYHNYTFIVGALFSLLLINPSVGRSDLLRLVKVFQSTTIPVGWLAEPKRPETVGTQNVHELGVVSWVVWQFAKWAVGFVLFVLFIANNGSLLVGDVMNSVMMNAMGMGNWGSVLRVFLLPLYPASGAELISLMPTMEIQYKLLYVIVVAFLSIVIIRILLRTFANFAMGNAHSSLPSFLTILAAIDLCWIAGAPYWLMNVTTPFLYGILWTLFIVLAAGIVYSKALSGKASGKSGSRRSIFRIVGILLGIVLIGQVSAVGFYSMNWNNNYLTYEWYPQTNKEITVTRWAAGLNNIKVGSLLNLPTSNASTTLGLVRQWDQQAAAVTMTKEIGAYNWMNLASSEIVFVNNTEYWMSPTTPTFPSSDWISRHLIYTHASRTIVINTHSGMSVSPQQAFNVSSEPLIYYGESASTGPGPGGFDGSVYVHVPGYSEVENASYSGKPDYTLTGWQKAMWFITEEGQYGFAFSNYPIDMLWNREIFSRVGSILIPGLQMDPAAYLASDGKNVYYVVQVFISYPLQSGFSASPYLRFFGVVLVNVYDGSMQGYTVGNLIGSNSSDFLTTFYDNYYSSWKSAPSWLEPQLRYPEMLLGTPNVAGQLDYDFIFHVSDPFVWRSGSEFYERPSGNVVQYIPWAVGNSTYFVGMQLAHFVSATSKNLAGVYIAYGGDKLGQIDLYQNPSPSTTFIGPSAAENALTTNGQVRTQLTLLPNYRFGSYLLYSVGGQLEYFVAVYTNPGTAGVVTQLPFMTAVDPTTGNVGVGSAAVAAYLNLVGGHEIVTPTNETEFLINGISSLASSMNYTLVNVTSVNPTVWIRTGTVSISKTGVNQTLVEIAGFLRTYGPGSVAHAVYEWTDASGNLNVGVIQARGEMIIELYYISITS